jgi:hypothetical protein
VVAIEKRLVRLRVEVLVSFRFQTLAVLRDRTSFVLSRNGSDAFEKRMRFQASARLFAILPIYEVVPCGNRETSGRRMSSEAFKSLYAEFLKASNFGPLLVTDARDFTRMSSRARRDDRAVWHIKRNPG